MHRFRSPDQCPVESCQSREVLLLGQHLSLEGLQPGGQSCPSLPDLFGADQPEGRVVGQPLGIVHILIPRQAAVHRLPQQVGEGQARILRPRVRQVLLDEFAETQPLVQLPDQNQTSVGSDSRPLKIDPQGSVERELKGLILALTHWVSTSGGFPVLSSRMNTGDAYLLHPYHRVSNRKSGLSGGAGEIRTRNTCAILSMCPSGGTGRRARLKNPVVPLLFVGQSKGQFEGLCF